MQGFQIEGVVGIFVHVRGHEYHVFRGIELIFKTVGFLNEKDYNS